MGHIYFMYTCYLYSLLSIFNGLDNKLSQNINMYVTYKYTCIKIQRKIHI
jgi:hypothetical protein